MDIILRIQEKHFNSEVEYFNNGKKRKFEENYVRTLVQRNLCIE